MNKDQNRDALLVPIPYSLVPGPWSLVSDPHPLPPFCRNPIKIKGLWSKNPVSTPKNKGVTPLSQAWRGWTEALSWISVKVAYPRSAMGMYGAG